MRLEISNRVTNQRYYIILFLPYKSINPKYIHRNFISFKQQIKLAYKELELGEIFKNLSDSINLETSETGASLEKKNSEK